MSASRSSERIVGDSAATPALAARRVCGGWLSGRCGGTSLCAEILPSGSQGEGAGDGSELIAAFHKRIEALTWMNPATKAEAEAKLSTLYVGIGYPEAWHDYSNYEVKPDDVFGNIWRGDLAEYQRQVGSAGQTVDRKEWSMTPQTVNAVNLPLQNALNFPAGDSAAAVLRSAGSGCSELWRDRNGHRTRDQPHLRYRRQRVRLERTRAQLVDSRRFEALRGSDGTSWPHSTTRTSRSPICA